MGAEAADAIDGAGALRQAVKAGWPAAQRRKLQVLRAFHSRFRSFSELFNRIFKM